MKINTLSLKNFKCYQNQRFFLSDVTVFCGGNSVGKSTAIQALLVLLQSKFETSAAFNGDLVELGQYDDILNHDVKDDLEIKIGIEFDNSEETVWACLSEESDKSAGEITPEVFSRLEGLSPVELAENYYQYIQAERLGPEDNYPKRNGGFHKHWLGKKGEFTAEVFNEVSLSRERLLDGDPRIHRSSSNPQIFNTIQDWMYEISPDVDVISSDLSKANVSVNSFVFNGGKEMRPKNVGFGMSYSFGIVSALILAPVGGLVILENPEAHLHPRAQSYLGRLIALSSLAGVQVVVETHSDHLVNGIRVVACLEKSYKSDQFCIYNVHREEKKDVVSKRLKVGEDGELSDWPLGFFDQQAKDMKILITGKE